MDLFKLILVPFEMLFWIVLLVVGIGAGVLAANLIMPVVLALIG